MCTKKLHNDIKCDNILSISNAATYSCSPILIDFGKACEVGDAEKKTLTKQKQDKYRKKHNNNAPEVVSGSHPQSVKSDICMLLVFFLLEYTTFANTNH